MNKWQQARNERTAKMTTVEKALDKFFLPEDGDAFARSLGWADKAQMIYYEGMAEREARMEAERAGQREVERFAKIDPLEVYADDADYSGVY